MKCNYSVLRFLCHFMLQTYKVQGTKYKVQSTRMTELNLKKSSTSIKESSTQYPIHLQFEGLNVKVGEKQILYNVSGEVKPGEILAIMGPSGAGKSTLLNFLSGRAHEMILESGKVLINGEKATKKLRRRIGYVLQEDVFFSHLTVNQTLQFVGEVRLPDKLSKSEKRAIVNRVIDELGLRKCENTVMGGGMFATGCSGGEKKRCSIAVELITNPSLLILDEPTSGLDSSTAANLIQSVKRLAQNENRGVITTIHQPSSHVFHMFDKLLLMCNGQVAYYGKTSGVINFFEDIGMPCYPNWNPADFIMEQLTANAEIQKKIIEGFVNYQSRNLEKSEWSTNIGNTEQEKLKNGYTNTVTTLQHNSMTENGKLDVSNIPDSNSNGHTNAFALCEIAFEENNGSVSVVDIESTEKRVYRDQNTTNAAKAPRWPTGYKTQSIALCKRSFIQFKSEFWDKLSFLQTLAIAIITGLLWLNTPYDEDSLKDRRGLLFFVLIYLVMSPMFFALMTFPVERKTIAKERAAGMYRLSAYFTAKSVSEIPVLLFQPILLYTIVYWMTGLNRSPVFLAGILNIITISLLARMLGLCIAASIKNFKQSITCAVIFSLAAMLLGGFYTERIPSWLDWAKYISHITYAYNIFVRLEFQHATNTFKCSAKSAFPVCTNVTKKLTGSDILPVVTTVDIGIIESFVILWGYIALFVALFYLTLKYLNKPK